MIRNSCNFAGAHTIMKKLYDLDFLKEYYGEDVEAMKSILKLYIEETPKEIELIESALRDNNAREAKAGAHKVKTNVAMLGIQNTKEFIDAMHMQKADASLTPQTIQLFTGFRSAIMGAVEQLQKDFFAQ